MFGGAAAWYILNIVIEAATFLKDLPIQTPRLQLCLAGPEWAEHAYEAVAENRQHLAGTMRWDPMIATPESTLKFHVKALRETREGKQLALVMAGKEDRRFIGHVGAVEFKGTEAVIGYWVRASEAGKGYTTEAVKALCEFLFSNAKVARITAQILPENRSSIRVVEKLGFRLAGKGVLCGDAGACTGREHLIYELVNKKLKAL